VEDPATGAAAAALGAYLASRDRLPDGRTFTIHQGHDLGRPSVLRVEVPVDVSEGVRVSGTAVEIAARD
jgi:PhzF family phenazine biosynthesis protein